MGNSSLSKGFQYVSRNLDFIDIDDYEANAVYNYKKSTYSKYEDEGDMSQIPEVDNSNSQSTVHEDEDDDIIPHSITLMGHETNRDDHVDEPNQETDNNDNDNDSKDKDDSDMHDEDDIIQGHVTLMGSENTMITNNTDDDDDDSENNEIDTKTTKNDKCKKYGWWSYTFNAKSKYIIHIQFKMLGIESVTTLNQYRPGAYRKYGARYCTINGINAEIISFSNSNKSVSQNDNKYDNNEYVILKIDDKINRLWFVKRIGWCFDDGHGIYINVKRTVNGKLNNDN